MDSLSIFYAILPPHSHKESKYIFKEWCIKDESGE